MMDQSIFMDHFADDALINGHPVKVIWIAQSTDPGEYGMDYGITTSEKRIEIAESDKDKFVRGAVLQIHGQTYHVFREPVMNMESRQWEVELEA